MSTADLDKVGKVDELRISHVKALVTKLGGLGPVKAILRGEVEVQLKDSRAHFVQAEILWNKGFGRQIGCRSFTAYVRSIPELPERPENLPQHFKPVLVDTRIVRSEQYGGLVKVCKLLGVAFDGDNSSFIPYDPKHEVKEDVYWMWCQDGKQNQGKSVRTCRTQFKETKEIGLTVQPGDVFHVHSAGGGGWGDPGQRSKQDRERDRCLGMTS